MEARFRNTDKTGAVTGKGLLFAFALENPVTITREHFGADGEVFAYDVEQDNFGFKLQRTIPALYIEVIEEK